MTYTLGPWHTGSGPRPAAHITECGDYKSFNLGVSDISIRRYMKETYGVHDCEIIFSSNAKLAGPISRWMPADELRDHEP